MTAEHAAYRQHPDALLTRTGDGEGALMHLGTSLPYALNETGLILWDLLEEPRGRQELVEAIVAEFDVDHDTAGADVDAFLHDLLAAQLVLRDAGTEAP